MLEALRHSLGDPIRYALPFFLLTIVSELVTLAVLGKSEGRFTARDSVTNLATGAVALAPTAVFHAVELLLYAALYVYVAPWHLPAGYVFGPPGWQPTPVDLSERQTPAMVGAGLTSETL